jgi:hypothetical protein
LTEFKQALSLLEKECLNETVLAGSKWQNFIKRYKALEEKLVFQIEEKTKEDLKTAKMLLKCAGRILSEVR